MMPAECNNSGRNHRAGLSLSIWFATTTSLLLAWAIPALGAPQSGHEANHSAGPVPREILERPVPLRQGIGGMHEKVNTASTEAQAFYDQGLAYLHSFVWIEAVRSFHQALRSDPNLAMAYLGLADAYIGLQDPVTARSAFNAAKAHEKHMTDRERVWLVIRDRELDYLESGEDPDKYVAYRKSISEAIRANPNDPWLWIQRGQADEGSPTTHGQAGSVDTLSFYKTALDVAPGNLAALHYLAHTNENLGHTKEALEGSATYVRLAPAIPHAHHMHGHELLRSGRTEEAIQEFLKTKELEETYYRAENIPPQFDWHHAHNLQLLAFSYQILGQVNSAEALFQQSFALPAYTEFLEYNRRAWPEFLLNRSRFEEALTAARKLGESPVPMARLAAHSIAGEALLGLGRLDDAKDELQGAERETEHLSPRVVGALPHPFALRAAILLREKSTEEGEPLILNVIKSLRSSPGPDSWCTAIFALESIAREARQSGDWKLAEFTAQEMIKHNSNYAGAHFALGLVAEHAGHSAEAREQFAAAEKLWSKADKDLPELRRIHEGVSARR